MDALALRKGFCQVINWFYIIAAIFCLLSTFATASFLIAFISQPLPGKGVYGIAKHENLDSSMRKKKKHCYIMFLWVKQNWMKQGQKSCFENNTWEHILITGKINLDKNDYKWSGKKYVTDYLPMPYFWI